MMKLQTDERERKTRRLQLVIRPSVYKLLQELKGLTGLSVNEIVNQILDEHVPELVDQYGSLAEEEQGGTSHD